MCPYTDGIVLGAYFLPCGVAKASVADIPFFGTFTKVGACPFAIRSNGFLILSSESVDLLHAQMLRLDRCYFHACSKCRQQCWVGCSPSGAAH